MRYIYELLFFKDGEVWRVIRVTHSGVLAVPYNTKTKDRNISLALEMSNDFLEGALK